MVNLFDFKCRVIISELLYIPIKRISKERWTPFTMYI